MPGYTCYLDLYFPDIIWMVFQVTGIGLLGDILRTDTDLILGGEFLFLLIPLGLAYLKHYYVHAIGIFSINLGRLKENGADERDFHC